MAVSVKELLEAGVHFGHQTRRWNPKMKPFIFEERNGIYIIDLQQSVTQLQHACDVVTQLASKGENFLFVGTKKQAQESIKEAAGKCGAFFVTERWLGGMLTNNQTIRKSVKRLILLEEMESDGTTKKLAKKEQAALRREKTKLDKNLSGVKEMEKVPAGIFVVDTKREEIAIAEARKLNIPVFAILDTNCDPDKVDYPIAGNDDAIKSIRLIAAKMAEAINAGKQAYVPPAEPEPKKEEAPADKEKVPAVEAKAAPAEKAPAIEAKAATTEKAPAAEADKKVEKK